MHGCAKGLAGHADALSRDRGTSQLPAVLPACVWHLPASPIGGTDRAEDQRHDAAHAPHLASSFGGSSPFTTPSPRRLEEGMWSAFLRAPSPSALEVLADAVQVADALPIPPRAAFAPLLKAVAAKSTHAAVVLRAIARHHPSAAARAGAAARRRRPAGGELRRPRSACACRAESTA